MEAVDVLLRRNRLDDAASIDVIRQRKLHEDAVDGRIGIELFDQRNQFFFGGLGWQRMLDRIEAALLGPLAFGGDIDLAGRIVPDNDHCDAWRHTCRRHQIGSRGYDAGDHIRCRGLAVDKSRHQLNSHPQPNSGPTARIAHAVSTCRRIAPRTGIRGANSYHNCIRQRTMKST